MSAYPKLIVTVEVEVWPGDFPQVQHAVETGEWNMEMYRYFDDAKHYVANYSDNPEGVTVSVKKATKPHWADVVR